MADFTESATAPATDPGPAPPAPRRSGRLDDVMKALRAADAAGNAEDARRLAEIADRLRKGAEPQDGGIGGSFVGQVGAGFNASTADIIDLPDRIGTAVVRPLSKPVADFLLTQLGADPAEEYTPDTSNAISRFLRSEPMNPPPTGPGGRIGRETGEVIAETLPTMAVPFMGAAGRTAAAAPRPTGGAIRRAMSDIVTTTARAPGKVAAAETAGATLSGTAMGAVKEAGGGPMAQMGAGVVLPALALSPAAALRNLASSRAGRFVARALPFTETGAQVRAERRMREVSGDWEADAAALAEPTEAGLSPAQRTGNPRLMALERAVLDADAALDRKFATNTEKAARDLRQAIDELGGGADVLETRRALEARREGARSAIEGQRDRRLADIEGRQARAKEAVEARRRYLQSLVDLRLEQARELATQRIAALEPSMRQTEAATIVREEIERALAPARQHEAALWRRVPRDEMVSTENALDAYRAALDDLPRAQYDDMPTIARQMLHDRESMPDPWARQEATGAEDATPGRDFIGREATVHEVWGLRSELLEQARLDRAAGRRNRARIADNLADALLDDLGATPGAVRPEGAEMREALDFSREMARRFRQGTVGRLLGSERTGGVSVAPEMTLERAIGRGGTRGAVGLREMEAATPSVIEGVEQYLLREFERAAVRGGRVNREAAQRFVADNADVLDRFPEMRANMEAAETTAELLEGMERTAVLRRRRIDAGADRIVKRLYDEARTASREAEQIAAGRLKRLESKDQSRAAEFLGAPPDQEIDRIVRSENPAAFAMQIIRQVRRDPTGRARKGLETAAVDYLIRRASRGEFDEAGNQALSGRAIRSALNEPKVRATLRPILGEERIGRLKRIADELAKIETARGRLPAVGEIIEDQPLSLISLVARTLAARSGAQAGAGTSGASLLTAHYFSQRARRLLLGLTNDRARRLIVRAVDDPELFAALLTRTSTVLGRRRAAQRLNAWLVGPGAAFVEEWLGDDENNPDQTSGMEPGQDGAETTPGAPTDAGPGIDTGETEMGAVGAPVGGEPPRPDPTDREELERSLYD